MNMIAPSIIVIENFYEQPDKVREYALRQKYRFDKVAFPGKRTNIKYYPTSIHDTIKTVLSPYYSDISVSKGSSNGEFQITNKDDKSWIHQDNLNEELKPVAGIAGVCYLTPNAPLDSGTIFFEKDSDNNYIQTDTINNKYNRLILFNSDLYHMSGKYFGIADNEARLTQVFFFDCS